MSTIEINSKHFPVRAFGFFSHVSWSSFRSDYKMSSNRNRNYSGIEDISNILEFLQKC